MEKQFAARLTQLRLAKGVSARDMSLSLGQSESYINRIESGKMMPSMAAFFVICEYLDISPRDFFDFEGAPTPETMESVYKIDSLSPEKREHILAVIGDL